MTYSFIQRIVPCSILLLSTLLLSGCLYSREIAQTQRAIERHNPDVDFDRQFMFSMGSGSIGGLAELGSFFRQEEVRMASRYLEHVRRIKIGVFEVRGDAEATMDLSMLPHFRRGGWQTLARINGHEGDDVAVLYRERFGEVRDLFVVSLSEPDLVIVRVTGNFTEMLIDALADFSDRIPRLNLFREPDLEPAALDAGD